MAKTKKSKKKSDRKKALIPQKRTEIAVLLAVAFVAVLFWNSVVIYPVKLFVVALHEISHAIVTIFTGGSVIGMDVNSGLYGTVNSEGGNEFLIASSGYIGSLIWGFFIFISADKKRLNLILSTALSVILLLFIANFFKDSVSIVILLIYVILFYAMPRYFPPAVNYWFARVLGLLSSLYVLFDIKEDLFTKEYLATDADKLAIITTVPAIYWSIFWFAVTISAIFFMLKITYLESSR